MALPVEDVIAIQQLVARYNFAVDDGDGETFAACFAPDGVFHLGETVIEGREALDAFARGVPARLNTPRHISTNLLVDGDGDRATLRAYVRVFVLPQSGAEPVLRTQGRYDDALVRQDGGWVFTTRRFTPEY